MGDVARETVAFFATWTTSAIDGARIKFDGTGADKSRKTQCRGVLPMVTWRTRCSPCRIRVHIWQWLYEEGCATCPKSSELAFPSLNPPPGVPHSFHCEEVL